MKDNCVEVALAKALSEFEEKYNINVEYKWDYKLNAIERLEKKLEKLGFGECLSRDKKIIKIICKNLDGGDWCGMQPIYIDDVWSYNMQQFISKEIKENKNDIDYVVSVMQRLIEELQDDVNIEKDGCWIYRDGANHDLWAYTHKGFVSEVNYWISDCLYEFNDSDINAAEIIIEELEKAFP